MRRLRLQGSPALAANWSEESDNKVLKAMAAAAHAITFHRRLLGGWRARVMGTSAKKRRTGG